MSGSINTVDKSILFVGHEANRTGAPVILLNFLRWLNNKNIVNITVFLKRGGELEPQYHAAISDVIKPVQPGLLNKLLAKARGKNLVHQIQIPEDLKRRKFDLIYINTVAALDVAPLLKKQYNCPVICHVHENSFTIDHYFKSQASATNMQVIDQFIAVSESTKINLMQAHGIPADKITLIAEFVNTGGTAGISATATQIKAELGIADKFVVGSAGLISWRKGADLFLQLASALQRYPEGNDIKLVWLGKTSSDFEAHMKYETNRIPGAANIIFAGQKEAPQNYFQVFDVFALMSREDPFPLVALEAASLGKPIVCFENTGGIADMLAGTENGIVVPYANVEAMAAAIIKLKNNSAHRENLGQNSAKLISHFDIDKVAPRLLAVIERYLN